MNFILDISRYMNISRDMSYIEKLISTGSHFFSLFLLVNKLYELNFIKLQNIFQTYPEA